MQIIIPPTPETDKPSRAGPSVTGSAGLSQRWNGGIIVDILAKESKFP